MVILHIEDAREKSYWNADDGYTHEFSLPGVTCGTTRERLRQLHVALGEWLTDGEREMRFELDDD